jgi:intein-encoded DNA endonuclease-like protein
VFDNLFYDFVSNDIAEKTGVKLSKEDIIKTFKKAQRTHFTKELQLSRLNKILECLHSKIDEVKEEINFILSLPDNTEPE